MAEWGASKVAVHEDGWGTNPSHDDGNWNDNAGAKYDNSGSFDDHSQAFGGGGSTANGKGFDDQDQGVGGGAHSANDDGFNNEGQAFGGGGNDNGCFNCGEVGHMKSDCPNPRVMKCNHCGQQGHMVRDCPDAPPREFTGTCRTCDKEGHMAKDCPDKPPEICRNCDQEGHHTIECKNPRNLGEAPAVDPFTAWKQLKTAMLTTPIDMDDVKEAAKQYTRVMDQSSGGLDYVALERVFRDNKFPVYLIGIKRDLLITHTNMDLQGNLDKTYTVVYSKSKTASRPKDRALWPKNDAENNERLADAGEVVARNIVKCSNCDQLGHTKKSCPEEAKLVEQPVAKCWNCDEEGHRVRDCPQPRKNPFACKNCGSEDHQVRECTEPRQAGDDVECRKCGNTGHYSRDCPEGGGGDRACRNCGEEGHMARDCTQERKMICRNCDGEGHRAGDCPEPKNMDKVQCRNCDEFGHEARGCDKPRDMSRVTCQACGEKGHFKSRCTNEATSFDDAGFGGDAGGSFEMVKADASGGNGGGDGW